MHAKSALLFLRFLPASRDLAISIHPLRQIRRSENVPTAKVLHYLTRHAASELEIEILSSRGSAPPVFPPRNGAHRANASQKYSPPRRNSAIPCAISYSFRTKHWYMPRSSRATDVTEMRSLETVLTRAPVLNGWPSFSQ